MLIFIQEIGLQLFLWLLQLIDGLMEIFSAISGVANVNYHGQQVNIVEFIVGDSTIGAVFWCIFITAVGLTCIFTIVGLVKNMISGNRGVATVVGKFFLALLGTMAMLAVVILGILIANGSLQLLARIFQVENTTKLSNAIFNACVGDWLNGYSAGDVDVTSLTVREILGGYDTALFGIWPTSWKGNGMVDPNTFLYLPSLVAGIALCVALVIAVLNLAKRVYEIVFAYFTMPIAMSTLPLDDGARFKNWRELFVSKLILRPMARCSRLISLRSFCRSSMRCIWTASIASAMPCSRSHDRGRCDAYPCGAGRCLPVCSGRRMICVPAAGGLERVLRRAHCKRHDGRTCGEKASRRSLPARRATAATETAASAIRTAIPMMRAINITEDSAESTDAADESAAAQTQGGESS